jgi:hypothetical protein
LWKRLQRAGELKPVVGIVRFPPRLRIKNALLHRQIKHDPGFQPMLLMTFTAEELARIEKILI